jgi:hypothetical protein
MGLGKFGRVLDLVVIGRRVRMTRLVRARERLSPCLCLGHCKAGSYL